MEIARIENFGNDKNLNFGNENNLNFDLENNLMENDLQINYENKNIEFETNLFFNNNINSLWSQIDKMFFKNDKKKNDDIIQKEIKENKIINFIKNGKRINIM